MLKIQCAAIFLSLLFFFTVPGAAKAENLSLEDIDNAGAVIYVYHQIGDNTRPETSLRLEQFKNHLDILKTEGHPVLPLPEIVAHLKSGTPLPDRTIAVTFDGTDVSISRIAAPLLLEEKLPFTIFIDPEILAAGAPGTMSWHDVRKLSKHKGVTLGLTLDIRPEDRLDEADIRRRLFSALAAVRDEIGINPDLFAYPYGERDKTIRDALQNSGVAAAFGHQSGAASPASDIYDLPRFAMTENYADAERFALTLAARPLPVTDIHPEDPYLGAAATLPHIGFTLHPDLAARAKRLACFISGQSEPDIQRVGSGRIELRPKEALKDDRIRINCTLPVRGEPERWRWLGLLLTSDPAALIAAEPGLSNPEPHGPRSLPE